MRPAPMDYDRRSAPRPEETGSRRRPRRSLRRRILLWTLAAAGCAVLLLAGFLAWVYLACFARPPVLAGRPAILDEAIRSEGGGRTALGRCWFRKDPGCSFLFLEGDPFTIGYAGATLTEEYL